MVISWSRRVVDSLRFWVSASRKGRKAGRAASANWARTRASNASVLACLPVGWAKSLTRRGLTTTTGNNVAAVLLPEVALCLRWPPTALSPDSGIAVGLSPTRCRTRHNRHARRRRRCGPPRPPRISQRRCQHRWLPAPSLPPPDPVSLTCKIWAGLPRQPLGPDCGGVSTPTLASTRPDETQHRAALAAQGLSRPPLPETRPPGVCQRR